MLPAVTRAPGVASRAAILSRGLRLAAHGGLARASIGALASGLGMSKSAVFAHFGSKPRLDVAIVEAAVARFERQVVGAAAAAPPGVARIVALSEAWLAQAAVHDEALDVLAASCPQALAAQRDAGDRLAPVVARVAPRADQRGGDRRRDRHRRAAGAAGIRPRRRASGRAPRRRWRRCHGARPGALRYRAPAAALVGHRGRPRLAVMKIATWNVNGIRARQGQLARLAGRRTARRGLPAGDQGVARPAALRACVSSSTTGSAGTASKGYSGVALLVSKALTPLPPVFSHPPFDFESRVISAEVDFGNGPVLVSSFYVPNGGKDYDAKLRFLESMDAGPPRRRRPDGRCSSAAISTWPAATSTSIPRNASRTRSARATTSGRSSSGCCRAAWSTSAARCIPTDDALFTWWAPWRNLKQRNIGWRIDYVVASAGAGAHRGQLRGAARGRRERPRPGRGDVRLTQPGDSPELRRLAPIAA